MGESIYSGSNENTSDERTTRPMPSFATYANSYAAMPPVSGTQVAQQYRLEAAAFQHALVALTAKLATIDGAANKSEYVTFHALFVAESSMDEAQARSLFVQRATDQSSALQYARQIAGMTRGQGALHEDVLHRLLQVALADGELNAAELELLRAVADVFGLAKETFRAVMSQSLVPASASPYEVLGIAAKASDKELREHYMARVQKLHPDRYQAAGASAETIAMLSDQLAALNAAYKSVQQSRVKKSARAASWFGLRNTKGARMN